MTHEEINAIKPIILTDTETGTEYTLEFNAETVQYAQRRGLNHTEIDTKPMVVIPEMFAYAFRMHHKKLAPEKINSLWKDISDGGIPEGFIERLMQLYLKPMECLFASEEGAKNSKVAVLL